MIFIGCDPGASGAIAVVDDNGAGRYSPRGHIAGDATDADILAFLRDYAAEDPGGCFAALEEVGAKPRITPGGERVSMGAKGAFTFGASYGRLSMALVAVGIPFDRVLPAKWQAVMRCRTKGDKRVSKARAQELFPAYRITHRTADAYLIAMWRRQQHRDQDNPAAEAAKEQAR